MESSLTTSEILIQQTHRFVEEHMSKPPFDASHNYGHVCRVLAIAQNIMEAESVSQPGIRYDPTIVALGALLHDVSDHKYLSEPVPPKKNTPISLLRSNSRRHRKNSETSAPTTPTPLSFLLSISCPVELAHRVQVICDAVSFSREQREPDVIRSILETHPELKIVQDADRLDAIGAIEITRSFTFGASPRGLGREMHWTMGYLLERSNLVEGMMKTETGKREARVSLEKIRIFQSWFQGEMDGKVGVNFMDWVGLSR
ncbi:hypothetical protein MMC22_002747 [Lobaria immixta]|nr:hypothetical protein [Lobaria immixta]